MFGYLGTVDGGDEHATVLQLELSRDVRVRLGCNSLLHRTLEIAALALRHCSSVILGMSLVSISLSGRAANFFIFSNRSAERE